MKLDLSLYSSLWELKTYPVVIRPDQTTFVLVLIGVGVSETLRNSVSQNSHASIDEDLVSREFLLARVTLLEDCLEQFKTKPNWRMSLV